MRSRARFQSADVSRAIKGVTAAGKSAARVRIDLADGSIVIDIGKPNDCSDETTNEWDLEFNGKDQTETHKRVPEQKPQGR
jgi:hypothetical protein